jgi:hypothetical protein
MSRFTVAVLLLVAASCNAFTGTFSSLQHDCVRTRSNKDCRSLSLRFLVLLKQQSHLTQLQ